jgi:hypothetical protein
MPPGPDALPASTETLPNLKTLNLRGSFARPKYLTKLIEQSPSTVLTTLSADPSALETSQLMTLLHAGKLAKLTYLRTSHFELTDTEMDHIITGCPLLETVELCDLKITGVTVKELGMRTRLKSVRLSNCAGVGGDAIEWARLSGIEATVCNFAEGRVEGGGTRVRYG